MHFDTHKYKHVYKCTNLVFEKAVQHIFHIGNDLFEFKMSKSDDHVSQFCMGLMSVYTLPQYTTVHRLQIISVKT